MQMQTHSRWTAAVVALVVITGAVLVLGQPAVSYQADAETTKWDYTAVNIPANELPAKLIELGNDGWEVFAIVRVESKVLPDDGSPRLIAEKYEICAKKPRR